MRILKFGEGTGSEWGGSNLGVLDTKPELSPAPSASTRRGEETSVGVEGVGQGVGDIVKNQWTPKPISRYYFQELV